MDEALLPTLIDERARIEPDRLYCAFLKTVNVNDGVVKLSYSEFANAVNRLAWFIEETFGKSDDFTTLAYVGLTDIRYALVTLAAAKTGHKAFLMSMINPVPAQLRLLEAAKCNHLLVAADFPAFKPAIAAMASRRPLNVVEIASVDHWIAKEKAKEYPFTATLSDNPRRPFVSIHTSGSTGFPDLITYNFAALTAYRYYNHPRELVPDAPMSSQEMWANKCIYMTLPPMHMIGMLHMTAANYYWNMPPIMGPPNIPPTPDLASSIIALDFCETAALFPALIHAMAQKETHLEGLRKLDHVSWVGAPLSPPIADKVRAYVTMIPAYGSTENGGLPLNIIDQADYEWMSFSPIAGVKFRQFSDELYELVQEKDEKLLPAQFIFLNSPKITEWHSKDLFSKHPTKELWKYQGRADDTFVMTNGPTCNPLGMEAVMVSHPRIITALLAGHAREKTVWLLEVHDPPGDEEEKVKLVDELWPYVEKANEIAQSHMRVMDKQAIVFNQKEKPFPRAGKGSVQRKLALAAYEKELDSMHS